MTVEQLVSELDSNNPPPVVTGVITNDKEIQDLVFQAGRRSIVDELLRLMEREE